MSFSVKSLVVLMKTSEGGDLRIAVWVVLAQPCLRVYANLNLTWMKTKLTEPELNGTSD